MDREPSSAERACELCRRQVAVLTKHHLIPRTRHKNKQNKKNFERREVRQRVAWVCKPCHKQIHSLLDEKTLEREYNTVQRLTAHPEVARFVTWIRDKPDGTTVTSHRSRRRRYTDSKRLRWS